MKRTIAVFDTTIRLIGSLCLVCGVLFSIVGLENRTASTVFLWLALLLGFSGLIASFFGKRAWYGGVVLFLAAYLFMISRFSTDQSVRLVFTLLALLAGFGGLSDNFIKRNYNKSLFIKK